ncbi:MAG: ASKHA domain-containing protein [Kiritimatiellae bacterium]|nr:ASKHA domain-containing protein [Kiritimatiellia bacterium]
MTITVRLGGETRTVPLRPGETLDCTAARAGWPLNTLCGGRGRCGRCAVIVESGRIRIRAAIAEIHRGEPRRVLACQTTTIEGAPCEFEIPVASRSPAEGRVVADCAIALGGWRPRLHRAEVRPPPDEPGAVASDAELAEAAAIATGAPTPPALDIDALERLHAELARYGRAELWWLERAGRALPAEIRSATAPPPLGLALDIGTTTVVATLVELDSGQPLATASDYNAQMSRGADVASRISAAEDPAGRRQLQELVIGTANRLIQRACARAHRSPDDILHVVLAGNSVMEHLALGLSPVGIGRIPFRPAARRYPPLRATRVGLATDPRAWVEAIPSLSGHVGGDLTADAAISGLLDRTGRWLLVDIGTNGEILFWNGQRLLCAATAAGPAFEGAGLACGMRAEPGAIERLRWHADHFEYETIGGAPPVGICGSAAVDALAELARAGRLDATGRLDWHALRRAGAGITVHQRGHDLRAVIVAPSEPTAQGSPIVLSEADIAELLKAKAAVHAGIVTLLRAAGCGPHDLDGVIVAGGFGRHLHLRNAMRIGLLPDLPLEIIEVIGNGALGGALQGLGDPRAPEIWERLVRIAEPVELNLCEGFEGEFVDSLLIPHADPSRFEQVLADESNEPPAQPPPTTSHQIR